jgi:hypothetical protein
MVRLWQLPSLAAGLSLVFPLRVEVELEAILAEFARLQGSLQFGPQSGPYHNGKWNRVGLVAPGGDHTRTYPHPGERNEPTELLKALPSVQRIFDLFEGPVRAASISRMEPGAKVKWHRDVRQSADLEYVRLHLPIITTPQSTMVLAHHTTHLTAGQLWYGDFNFPHRVDNDSKEARIHIMFDVPSKASLMGFFPDRFGRERTRRKVARRLATGVFDGWQKSTAGGQQMEAQRAARAAALERGEDPVPAAGRAAR